MSLRIAYCVFANTKYVICNTQFLMDPSPQPSPPNRMQREDKASRGGEGEHVVTSSARRDTWRITTIRTGIAVYWLTMFLATHLPVQQVMEQLPTTDKHLHFGAYAVLGFALPWWGWAATWGLAARLWMVILLYAALDELLQIPVGRSAEWGDWFADAAGALIGVCTAVMIGRRLSVQSRAAD